MNGDFVRFKGIIAVAVGASFMISAAGVFLYHQYCNERKRRLMQQDLSQLDLSISEIRKELDALKLCMERMAQRNDKQGRGAPSFTTDAETEMFSTIGGDDLNDDFYDLTSDNGIVGEEAEISFEQIDKLLEGSSREDKTKAYGLLLEILEKNADNDEVLWRLAKSCHMMSSIYNAEGSNDKNKEFIMKGVDFGQKAIELNNDNWKAHKWYAVCIGGRGQLQSVKQKLQDGHLFKKHVDKALEINHEDPVLHHLLGRFNYEVASLSWLEKKLANTLFGEVPKGSFEDGIKSLLEAEKSNKSPWKENRLLIAKCYAAQQDYQQTLKWLDSAKEIETSSAEDKLADKEIEVLLKKFNSYRNRT